MRQTKLLHLYMFQRSRHTTHYTGAGSNVHEAPNTTPVQVSALTNRQAPFGTFSNDPKFPHRDSFGTTFFDAWAHAGMEPVSYTHLTLPTIYSV